MAFGASFPDRVWPAIHSVATIIFGRLQYGLLFSGPHFGVTSGFRYISFTDEYEGGSYEFRYAPVCLPGSEARVPFEYVAPEIASFFNFAEYGPPSPLPGEAGMIGNWTTGYLGTVMTAIEEFCGATCTLGAASTVEVIPGVYKRRSQIVQVSTPGRIFTLGFELNYGPATLPSGSEDWYADPSSWRAQVNLPANTELARSAGRAAQALEDLAMTRIEVGMNNGDTVFNIVGGTRTSIGS